MESEKRDSSGNSEFMAHSSRQCLSADYDRGFFPSCGEPAIGGAGPGNVPGLGAGLTPCQKLVRTVCGANDACGDREACGVARQMRDMERSDAAVFAPGINPGSNECARVIKSEPYFDACTATRGH